MLPIRQYLDSSIACLGLFFVVFYSNHFIDREIMGFLSSFLGIIGFGIGIPFGLLVGYFLFIYFEPTDVKDPIIRPIHEMDTSTLLDIFPEIPMWVKHYDYDRIDWMNQCVSDIWPYLDKAACGLLRSKTKPIFEECIGKFQINSIDFETLTLGSLPPMLYGIKVHESNENELVFEPVVKWAGNPNITVVLEIMFLQVTVQVIDIHVSVAPRILLKPLVPAFPCFSKVEVSLLEKPRIDFGLKLLGADIMAIPGLYQFVQETIRKQVARLYLWPQTLEIPILDSSVGAEKKPVGILQVKIVRALKLLKMDLLGTSDPYVQVSLSGERLPAKKTSIKMKNLNPVWNEEFKLTVKDPEYQVLQLHVFDWEKVGTHDKLGMQVLPLRLLTPNVPQEFTLDLVKNTNPNDPHNKKTRGQLIVELTFNPFKDENETYSGSLDGLSRKESNTGNSLGDPSLYGTGLLLVTLQGARDVEGKIHNNPYALILFRGEQKKTKIIKRTHNPSWNEEFQFLLEEAPVKEKIHIEVMSKRKTFGFCSKESLGHVDINLIDVVYNGRINHKYHLINSKNGVIHIEIRWKVI